MCVCAGARGRAESRPRIAMGNEWLHFLEVRVARLAVIESGGQISSVIGTRKDRVGPRIPCVSLKKKVGMIRRVEVLWLPPPPVASRLWLFVTVV
jgi:hypothetical protein